VINKFRAERLECAWARCGALVQLIDARGMDVGAEDVQRAALVPLTDQAAQAAWNLAVRVLVDMDALTAVLAGYCPKDLVAMFANWPSTPKAQPRRRPRRPRPTAAERRASAARRAAEWLAGPAWEIVDPDAAEPLDGECP
jgi:hypothetical protein